MRHVRLIAVCDDYDTTPGFALKGAPVQVEGFMADRDGVLIAHDLLEHVNGRANIGTVWDELEALGAIHQVRGRHGDLAGNRPMYRSVAYNLAADITRMFPEWCAEDYTPPKHRIKATRPHLYDDDFLEAIAYAREDIPKEYEDDCDRKALEAYLSEALHRMRTGFRKAERKYGDGWQAFNVFVAIRDAIKASYPPEYEGQEYTLSYDRNGRAYVQKFYNIGEY